MALSSQESAGRAWWQNQPTHPAPVAHLRNCWMEEVPSECHWAATTSTANGNPTDPDLENTSFSFCAFSKTKMSLFGLITDNYYTFDGTGKPSRRNGDWTLFWNEAYLGPIFTLYLQFLTLGNIVGWAVWHSQLDLDRQLLIIWWALNLVSWKHIKLHRWFHWNKVLPTCNLSRYWSASLSLLPQLLVADSFA